MNYLQNRRIKTCLLLLYYGLATVLIAYGAVRENLFNLNAVQLDRSGDGFKNYFTFAYHYQHGNGFWFEGMQYPYGDLVLYADGQTFFLFLFKSLKAIGIDITGKELLILQILPIVGLFIGALLLHKIMRSFNQPVFWTALTVTFCLALSPQLYKFNSHFALAYAFCIPSIWYSLILYQRKKISRLIFTLIASVLLLIFAFIHPYQFAISLFFLLAYFVIQLMYKKLDWGVLIAALIPAVIFILTISGLDPYTDRPVNPWGAWHHKTEISDLFPFQGWFHELFGKTLELRNNYEEGYCYTGILFILFPFLFIKSKFKIDWKSNFIKYFFAAILVLLFALGVHLSLTNQEINNWIPKLRQFRTIGRFSWPFYYVGFIGLSIYFYNHIRRIQKKQIRFLCLGLIVCLWSIDAYNYSDFFHKKVSQYFSSNELKTNQELYDIISKSEKKITDFQAVMPLPVPMEGAEKVDPQQDWAVKTRVIPYTFQTGTPMIGANMSRVSLSNIMKQHQISSSAYVKKEILNDMPSEKDLLIVVNNSDTLLFQDILNEAYPIGSTETLQVLGIKVKSLAKEKTIEKLQQADLPPLFYNDYADSQSPGLLSDGAMFLNETEKLLSNLVDLDTLSTSKRLTFSFWFRIEKDKSSVPVAEVFFKDKAGKILRHVSYRDKLVKRMEVYKNWIQLKYTIDKPENLYSLDWKIAGENLFIDHALITTEDNTFVNNLQDNYAIWNHYIGKIE